jgi:hypothetical protein
METATCIPGLDSVEPPTSREPLKTLVCPGTRWLAETYGNPASQEWEWATGLSLALTRFVETITRRADQIEQLCLGMKSHIFDFFIPGMQLRVESC